MITLLCGAARDQAPAMATKSDPQPSILTQGALAQLGAEEPSSVQLERLGKVLFAFPRLPLAARTRLALALISDGSFS